MWKEVLIWLAGSIISSGILGSILFWALNRLANKHDDLKKEVTTLKDSRLVNLEKSYKSEDYHLKEKIKKVDEDLHKTKIALKKDIDKVENKLEKHKEADVSLKILTSLDTLNSTTARTDARVAKIAEDTADQNARINANKDYINNLDGSFQKHKNKENH